MRGGDCGLLAVYRVDCMAPHTKPGFIAISPINIVSEPALVGTTSTTTGCAR